MDQNRDEIPFAMLNRDDEDHSEIGIIRNKETNAYANRRVLSELMGSNRESMEESSKENSGEHKYLFLVFWAVYIAIK